MMASWRRGSIFGVVLGKDSFFFIFFFLSFFLFFFFCLLRDPRHKEVPRLGVESELLPPVYTIATTMQDPSHVCNLHHSSWQCQILNPWSKARD